MKNKLLISLMILGFAFSCFCDVQAMKRKRDDYERGDEQDDQRSPKRRKTVGFQFSSEKFERKEQEAKNKKLEQINHEFIEAAGQGNVGKVNELYKLRKISPQAAEQALSIVENREIASLLMGAFINEKQKLNKKIDITNPLKILILSGEKKDKGFITEALHHHDIFSWNGIEILETAINKATQTKKSDILETFFKNKNFKASLRPLETYNFLLKLLETPLSDTSDEKWEYTYIDKDGEETPIPIFTHIENNLRLGLGGFQKRFAEKKKIISYQNHTKKTTDPGRKSYYKEQIKLAEERLAELEQENQLLQTEPQGNLCPICQESLDGKKPVVRVCKKKKKEQEHYLHLKCAENLLTGGVHYDSTWEGQTFNVKRTTQECPECREKIEGDLLVKILFKFFDAGEKEAFETIFRKLADDSRNLEGNAQREASETLQRVMEEIEQRTINAIEEGKADDFLSSLPHNIELEIKKNPVILEKAYEQSLKENKINVLISSLYGKDGIHRLCEAIKRSNINDLQRFLKMAHDEALNKDQLTNLILYIPIPLQNILYAKESGKKALEKITILALRQGQFTHLFIELTEYFRRCIWTSQNLLNNIVQHLSKNTLMPHLYEKLDRQTKNQVENNQDFFNGLKQGAIKAMGYEEPSFPNFRLPKYLDGFPTAFFNKMKRDKDFLKAIEQYLIKALEKNLNATRKSEIKNFISALSSSNFPKQFSRGEAAIIVSKAVEQFFTNAIRRNNLKNFFNRLPKTIKDEIKRNQYFPEKMGTLFVNALKVIDEELLSEPFWHEENLFHRYRYAHFKNKVKAYLASLKNDNDLKPDSRIFNFLITNPEHENTKKIIKEIIRNFESELKELIQHKINNTPFYWFLEKGKWEELREKLTQKIEKLKS